MQQNKKASQSDTNDTIHCIYDITRLFIFLKLVYTTYKLVNHFGCYYLKITVYSNSL